MSFIVSRAPRGVTSTVIRAVSAEPSTRVAPALCEQGPRKGARSSPAPEYASPAVPVAGPTGSETSACAAADPAIFGGAGAGAGTLPAAVVPEWVPDLFVAAVQLDVPRRT